MARRKSKIPPDYCPYCGRPVWKCCCDWDEEYEKLPISPCCKVELTWLYFGDNYQIKAWYCTKCDEELKRIIRKEEPISRP